MSAVAKIPGQRQESADVAAVVPAQVLWAPEGTHLLSGTPGRLASDRYSWMQAVHWVHGSGLHVAGHGPKFGETTLQLADILAELTPCRPTIGYLMRRMGLKRRAVQYHLKILRSTGLLAWRSIGTRLPMMPGQVRVECRASEYERLVPDAYDQALGIRTVGDGLERRMTGISEEGRGPIAELGKKAARKLRRPRRPRRHRGAGQSVSTPCCTPMEGGTTDYLSSTSVVDSKTTGGARDTKSITRKKRAGKPAGTGGKRRRTVLGQVVTAAMMAASDQLAKVAYRRVPWVRQASHDQLRWILNDLTGRGWSEDRVMSWLGDIAGQYGCAGLLWRPERPHSLIAHALRQDVEQDQYNQELATRAASRVDDTSVDAVREATGELEFLADLFGSAATATVAPLTEQDRQEAYYFPAAAAARMEAAGDLAFDLFGADMVARYTSLAASPHVQLGVTH